MTRPLFTLGDRLLQCANFVRQDSVLADIGTDHAYLPIWLLKLGKIKFAYAADIAEKPLESAKANAEKYGVSDKLLPILCDGLSSVPADVTDIVIAGMGGNAIIGILSDVQWIKNDDKHLILQPMKDETKLRLWLADNGFEIRSEIATLDGGKVYSVMSICYNGERETLDEISICMGKLEVTTESVFYADKCIRKLENEIRGLKCEKDISSKKNIIKLIKEKYGGI